MTGASPDTSRNSWIDYWNRDRFWTGNKIWEKNAEIFLRRAEPVVRFLKTDSVLNIGCGPGHLEQLLAPLVSGICAADTSENLVSLCASRCSALTNVRTSLLSRNYTDLSGLGRFSVFLCVSVVQYYETLEDVEALIRSARQSALPGARMLIADLPMKRNAAGFFRDVMDSIAFAVKEKYFTVFIQTAWSLLFGADGYRNSSKKFKAHLFTREQIQAWIQKMDLNAEIIDQSVSIYANRPSLLIRFD